MKEGGYYNKFHFHKLTTDGTTYYSVFQLSLELSMSHHSQQMFMIGLDSYIFIYFGTYVEGTFPD